MVTQQEADAAFVQASVDTLDDPKPMPRLTTAKVRLLLTKSMEIAHCWIPGGVTMPLFRATPTAVRDEAEKVIAQARVGLGVLSTRHEHEFAFGTEQEDHVFLNQLIRDPINFDPERAMPGCTDHAHGNGRCDSIPPIVQLMYDGTASNQVYIYCHGTYIRSLNAAGCTKSLNSQLHCGLRDWFFLDGWQRGKVLLAAKHYGEWIKLEAKNPNRPPKHGHGGPVVKISDKIRESERKGQPWWSFEFFPPRTNDGWVNLYDRIERMKLLGPIFVDITWGAGGATSEATTAFVKTAHSELGLETCMHLTCTNMPVEMVDAALKEAKDSGCRNILALRGDPPRGTEEWVAAEGGFNHAIDLVKHIRQNYGDYFDIGVAGFPEGHPHSESPEKEMYHLRKKVDAGANVIFTQMFYDADVFIDWGRRVRAAGITIPIVPGIMPIQTYAAFKRRTDFAKTIVPQHVWDMLEPIKDDDLKVREFGTKFVADMCRKILNADIGINGIHIYTMNLSRGTEMLLDELNFVATADVVKPLPWRLSLTQKRRTETTRPIFWSNRQRSYLSRTADWDEFPNGRWGNQASPAFGDITSLALSLPHNVKDATSLWGTPRSLSDISALFAAFCRGQLKALPWSDQPAAKETTVISEQLAKINEAGFLTINSQPRVDGASSSDPAYGWGPKGGYVYQKAYLEFFTSPEHLEKLLKLIEANPWTTYHAVNKQGDLRTNAAEGPNAVTWGVFPGAEVIQPTVVDGEAFLAWKDEAFELGALWASLYKTSSPESAKAISDVFDTFYLVNIVYNDYRDPNPDAIFAPFYALAPETSPSSSPKPEQVNGASLAN